MALSLLPLSAESIRVGQLNRSYITYVPRNLGTNIPSCKMDDESVYDLNGRRVNGSNLRPGIYIKGGRKMVVK